MTSTLGFALLGLLARAPRSGYDIATQLKAGVGPFWHARHSQIYPELARLEADGLVSHERVEQRDRPDKKVFSVLPAGLSALAQWITSALRITSNGQPLLLLDSQAICAPSGTPLIVAMTQTRVTGS